MPHRVRWTLLTVSGLYKINSSSIRDLTAGAPVIDRPLHGIFNLYSIPMSRTFFRIHIESERIDIAAPTANLYKENPSSTKVPPNQTHGMFLFGNTWKAVRVHEYISRQDESASEHQPSDLSLTSAPDS